MWVVLAIGVMVAWAIDSTHHWRTRRNASHSLFALSRDIGYKGLSTQASQIQHIARELGGTEPEVASPMSAPRPIP